MIDATYSCNSRTREISLTVKGHAGYAEHGQDIVCASASILAYSAAQIIAIAESNGEIEGETIIKLDSGDTEIYCKARQDVTFSELATMLQMLHAGFLLLSHNFPENVRYTYDVMP